MTDLYNHIQHFMDTSDEVNGIIGSPIRGNDGDHNGHHKPSQLDWKQNHTRFNYFEYDTLKFAPAENLGVRSTGLDFLEHLEDPEHDQSCHQSIYGHGQGETRYGQSITPVSIVILALYQEQRGSACCYPDY